MSNDLSISSSSLSAQSVSEVNSFGLKADFGTQKPVPSSVLNNTGKALLVVDHAKHNRAGDEVHTSGTFTFQGGTVHNAGISATTISASDVISTSSYFSGSGSGLTGTGSSFTAGDANKLGWNVPSYYMPSSYRGNANGVASLDSNGKVPVGQLPSTIVGAMKYQGVWNAASNSPALPAASDANLGFYYVVSVAGSTSINGQTLTVNVGDWVVSDGSAGWVIIDNTDQVSSVNGKGGAVVLSLDDISNVAAPSPADKDVLYFNGSNWVNLAATSLPFAQDLNGLTDVTVSSPSSGQLITYDGSQWRNTNFPSLDYIPLAQKNAASGVATLDSSKRVDATQAGLIMSDATGSYSFTLSGGALTQTKL